MKQYIEKHPLAAVFAFVTVCVLPMMLFRDPSAPNELRYLSIAEEALREGHFWCFYNQGIPYTDKPPLFFWILMLFRLICGRSVMWLPCLFTSLIPAFVTVAVMDRWLALAAREREYTPLMRLCCASLLLAGLLFAVQTFFLRMDLLMTMFIVLALFTFWKMYTPCQMSCQAGYVGAETCSKANKWLLPIYIFLALFTKGPVGFFAPVLIITAFLTLEGQLRRIGEFLGLRQWLVMLVLFGSWILGAYLEGGREYINNLLFHQTLDRAVNAFTHKHPFWWYLPTLLYTVLPYTLLTIPALIYMYTKRHGGDSFVRLLLTSIAVIFIMLSAFSGKLAIYLTPLMPLMAYLMPRFATLTAARSEKAKRAALIVPSAIIALAGLAFWLVYLCKGFEPFSMVAFPLAVNTPYIFSTTLLVTAAVLTIGFAAACIIIGRGGWQKGAIAMAATLYLAIFAFGSTVSRINEWLGYRCVAEEALLQNSGSDTYNTLFVNRPENMDLYLGCDVTDFKDDAARFVATDHRGEVLIVNTARLRDCQPIKEYLESNEGTPVGEFTVFSL